MLCELPDATGLGASERRILALAERQDHWLEAERHGHDMSGHVLSDEDRSPMRLIHRLMRSGERVPLCYFELGQTICELATAPVPALSGIPETRFSLDLHDDREHHRRFRESMINLTEIGHRLMARSDDWSSHNPVHRWIGGTRLTNENLWRWDERLRQPTMARR